MAFMATRRRTRPLLIPQQVLLELANRHEPFASSSPPGYRKATCVDCGKTMTRMWHCWLRDGGFKKEIHLCRRCGAQWQ